MRRKDQNPPMQVLVEACVGGKPSWISRHAVYSVTEAAYMITPVNPQDRAAEIVRLHGELVDLLKKANDLLIQNERIVRRAIAGTATTDELAQWEQMSSIQEDLAEQISRKERQILVARRFERAPVRLNDYRWHLAATAAA